MTIILDNIIYSLQKKGGVSSYWNELRNGIYGCQNLDYIELTPKKFNYIFLNRIIFLIEKYKNIKFKKAHGKYIFHSSYYRTLNVNSKKSNIKEIVTVHDFTYELFSKGLKKYIHIWQKKRAIKNADIIICVSENTKKDLIKLYPQFSTKPIKVVYHGVSSEYYTLNNLSTFKNYFLFVGSREKYKNFHIILEIIAKISDFNLIIVGKKLNTYELDCLNKLLNNRWSIYENVENNQLNILYNNAFALVYPSSYEGFGIPLLEAMASGCPFIALNNSSIPEVSGNAGVLLSKLNEDEFYKAFLKIKNDRESIVNEGYEQLKKFSWEKCVTDTIDLYTNAFN